MDSKQLSVPALGRHANLGDLYDANTGQFLGVSMFKTEAPAPAVRTQDMHRTVVKKCSSASLLSKLDVLECDIRFELGIFVVIGTISIKGGFGFVNNSKTVREEVVGSMTCTMETVNEQLRLSEETLPSAINVDVLVATPATHFVCGVDHGCTTTVSLHHVVSKDESVDSFDIALGVGLDLFIASLSAEGQIGKGVTNIREESPFVYKIHTDLPECPLPHSPEAVAEYLAGLPDLLKKLNGGKGKPQRYLMLPVAALRGVVNFNYVDRAMVTIDESIYRGYLEIFNDVADKKAWLNTVLLDSRRCEGFIAEDTIERLRTTSRNLNLAEAKLKAELQEVVTKVKQKNIVVADMWSLLKDAVDGLKLKEIATYLLSIETLVNNQTLLVETLTGRGVTCVGQNDDFELNLYDKVSRTFVYFTQEGDDNSVLFRSISRSDPNVTFVMVYLSLKLARIFEKGLYEFKNAKFTKAAELVASNVALYTGVHRFVNGKPSSELLLPCPKYCSQDIITWQCFNCHAILTRDGEYFYCQCGRGLPGKYKFKCLNDSTADTLNTIEDSNEQGEHDTATCRPTQEARYRTQKQAEAIVQAHSN